MQCAEPECEKPAAVCLRRPKAADKHVCPAHARGLAQAMGVVAEPLEGSEGEWP